MHGPDIAPEKARALGQFTPFDEAFSRMKGTERGRMQLPATLTRSGALVRSARINTIAWVVPRSCFRLAHVSNSGCGKLHETAAVTDRAQVAMVTVLHEDAPGCAVTPRPAVHPHSTLAARDVQHGQCRAARDRIVTSGIANRRICGSPFQAVHRSKWQHDSRNASFGLRSRP